MCDPSTIITAILLGAALAAGAEAKDVPERLNLTEDQPDDETD